MALISQSDLETRLGRSLTSEETSAFDGINNALQAEIERRIGSSLESVSLSTRYYDGGIQNLAIDPCTSISSVKYVNDSDVEESTVDTTDYIAEPRNRTLKRWLRTRYTRFQRAYNNVAVNAKFSIWEDTAMRAEIKNLMLESLVSEYNDNEDVIKESIEGYSVEYASAQTKANLNKISSLFPEII